MKICRISKVMVPNDSTGSTLGIGGGASGTSIGTGACGATPRGSRVTVLLH